ncbi:MAG: hypothetical protein C0621_03910 [Desulfuromonas sp.]|nr:MAG: hypothetical protein C0621_03910 [Desulfuromonas sp.]
MTLWRWFLFLTFVFGFAETAVPSDLYEDAYARLGQVRQQKKTQVFDLFRSVQEKAEKIRNDELVGEFFGFLNGLYREQLLERSLGSNTEIGLLLKDYSHTFDEYCLRNYLDFYDVLFVSADGTLLYSLRKETDLFANLFSDEIRETELSRQLRNHTSTFFVDYQYYLPADEPAAFFIEPIREGKTLQGWIVLQYAINRLNTLMVDHQELGNTGEVYLVNEERRILTNSRFSGEETSLQLRVDTKAVSDAFRKKKGHDLINGYRGVSVLASYESFELWGTRWALVASIEEGEILTNAYSRSPQRWLEKILKKNFPPSGGNDRTFPSGRFHKVDIDEIRFSSADNKEKLVTRGVDTCTAISVVLPGRFAYLSHISPYDKIYEAENLTNLLKEMINRIKGYKIVLSELPQLRVTVIANHEKSIAKIIDKLIRYGFHLDQVRFLRNPLADYANVVVDPVVGETWVEWVTSGAMVSRSVEVAGRWSDIGSIMKRE